MRLPPGLRRLCNDNAFNLIRCVNRSDTHLDGMGQCGGLNGGNEEFGLRGCCRIEQERHAPGARSDLLQLFKPFTAHCGFDKREAGHVTARMREARGEAEADWIGNVNEHDRKYLCSFVSASRNAASQDCAAEYDAMRCGPRTKWGHIRFNHSGAAGVHHASQVALRQRGHPPWSTEKRHFVMAVTLGST